MKEVEIDKLVYYMNQAKEKNLPKPIVFLGAGASVTGNIPLANEIVDFILKKYKNNPDIQKLNNEEKTYPKLMECLIPYERNFLLKKYVDEAKINVTHIYLAQLMKEGYIDYLLTVNFDNLMLRALALYNEFPPTYDMAILKDMTTTTFKEKSIVYLHGQHHGLWLLNTKEEMAKGDEIIPPILNKITNQRLWIFIGYSGEDYIFKHITKLGRFDNGLYWVTYKDTNPIDRVYTELLEKDNTNAYLIKGYDSDSFMLSLNKELGLEQPFIIEKPFTTLKYLINNIVDIDGIEHFKAINERFEITKENVKKAIKQFEEGKVEEENIVKENITINQLKKKIIDYIIKDKYDENEIKEITDEVGKIGNEKIKDLLSTLYSNWGNAIYGLAKDKKDESLYRKSFGKYEKATELNPKDAQTFNNWGNKIYTLAKEKKDESLYRKSFEKYEKATELDPKNGKAFNNWGTAISALAKEKKDESLYRKSFGKYEKATELDPKDAQRFYNWGTAIFELARDKKDEDLYEKAFEILQQSYELGGRCYNIACLYALKEEGIKAMKYLKIALDNKEIEIEFVEKDPDWAEYYADTDFINIIKRYKR